MVPVRLCPETLPEGLSDAATVALASDFASRCRHSLGVVAAADRIRMARPVAGGLVRRGLPALVRPSIRPAVLRWLVRRIAVLRLRDGLPGRPVWWWVLLGIGEQLRTRWTALVGQTMLERSGVRSALHLLSIFVRLRLRRSDSRVAVWRLAARVDRTGLRTCRRAPVHGCDGGVDEPARSAACRVAPHPPRPSACCPRSRENDPDAVEQRRGPSGSCGPAGLWPSETGICEQRFSTQPKCLRRSMPIAAPP